MSESIVVLDELERLLTTDHCAPVAQSEVAPGRPQGGHVLGRENGMAVVWCDAFYENRAQLIAAARNALPGLIAVAKAAREMLDDCFPGVSPILPGSVVALYDALDALNNNK